MKPKFEFNQTVFYVDEVSGGYEILSFKIFIIELKKERGFRNFLYCGGNGHYKAKDLFATKKEAIKFVKNCYDKKLKQLKGR